jgi:hypothetical protein
VQYMAQHHIPITLCPISNLKLQVGGTHVCRRSGCVVIDHTEVKPAWCGVCLSVSE